MGAILVSLNVQKQLLFQIFETENFSRPLSQKDINTAKIEAHTETSTAKRFWEPSFPRLRLSPRIE